MLEEESAIPTLRTAIEPFFWSLGDSN